MSIEQFHTTADHLIDTIEAFIKANIVKTGNAPWECQQTAAVNEAMGLSGTLNGTAPRDLTHPHANHEQFFLAMDRATAEALIEAVNVATMAGRMEDAAIKRAQDATTRITDALVG